MNKEITPYQRENQAKKEQVEEMFDSIAPTYDRLNHILSLRIDKLWRKNVIKLLRKQNPKNILDIATGTADLAIAMETLHPEKIVGLDLSEEMLNVGRQKIEKKKLTTLIEMVKGDSENLQFKDESFDAITCAFGARNFGNLNAGLSEMARVVKKEGQVIILEFSTPKNKIFQKLYYFYFFNVLPFVGNLLSGDSRAYTYLPESVKAFPSGEDFANELKKSGFKTVICKPQTFGNLYHLPSKKIVTLVVLMFSFGISNAQYNIQKHDNRNQERKYSYGIHLGFSQHNFRIEHSARFLEQSEILGIEGNNDLGLEFGLIGVLHPFEDFEIRTIPSISFGDRSVNYYYADSLAATPFKQESTLLDLPIQVKYKSKPYKDFRMFALAGGKYRRNLSYEEPSADTSLDPLLYTQNDFMGELGLGAEFHFPLFTLAPEIKVSQGFLNQRTQNDNNITSQTLNGLYSRMYTFSINIE